MFDSHCHLDSHRFDADRAEVLVRARAAGVTDLMVPAIGPGTWASLRAWCEGRPGIHFALGIHPQILPKLDPRQDAAHLSMLEAMLEEQLSQGGARAIGECGLDGPASTSGAPRERQLAVLRGHLELARRFRLPVLLHCLRAHEPMLALLDEMGPLPAGGVLHSYSGSAEQVLPYLRHGLYFSMAGPLTYERAQKPVLAARAIPRERLLVETDAPDQTPRPHSGRCEPAHLVEVVRALSSALACPFDEIARQTDANARLLFGLAGVPFRAGATPGG